MENGLLWDVLPGLLRRNFLYAYSQTKTKKKHKNLKSCKSYILFSAKTYKFIQPW